MNEMKEKNEIKKKSKMISVENTMKIKKLRNLDSLKFYSSALFLR